MKNFIARSGVPINICSITRGTETDCLDLLVRCDWHVARVPYDQTTLLTRDNAKLSQHQRSTYDLTDMLMPIVWRLRDACG